MKKLLLTSAIAISFLMINNWSIAQSNTFYGAGAGINNTTGIYNAFFGIRAGENNNTGEFNTIIGGHAGRLSTIGSDNTFLGVSAGSSNSTGSSNTFLGRSAGHTNTSGERNIFLGYRAGFNEQGSDKLYIENSNDDIPLIYGDFATDGVGINTKEVAGYTLSVNGNVRATEVKVYTDWADFVFEDNYPLPTLAEVANHIKTKGHLAGIPSAGEVAKEGIYLGKMDAKLLQKIEELTLYLLAAEKQRGALEKQLQQQESRLHQQAELIKRIQAKLKW